MIRTLLCDRSACPWLVLTLVASTLVGCAGGGSATDDAEPSALRRTGDFGEPPPGTEAAIFAPGVISTQHRQRDTAVSPDGNLLFYSVWGEGRGTLVYVQRQDDDWSSPEVAPFSGTHSDIEPFFHPSGTRLYFASKRPLEGETEPGDWNLWSVAREGAAWATPAPLDEVNRDEDEYYPAVTEDDTVYFTAKREDSVGGEDIYRARRSNGGYGEAENLGTAVNTPGPEFNAYVAPDESVLIFSSVREGDHGGGDLYASFRDHDGSWTEALNLGSRVNGPALDYCPFVTPDGRYFFFTSTRTATGAGGRRSYAELVRALDGPSNGQGSIYWIDAGLLEEVSGAGLDSH